MSCQKSPNVYIWHPNEQVSSYDTVKVLDIPIGSIIDFTLKFVM